MATTFGNEIHPMTTTTWLDRVFAADEFGMKGVWGPATRSFHVPGFDLEKVEADLEATLKSESIDINDLLRDASVHFRATEVSPSQEPLSEEQLEELATDELWSRDRE